MINYTDNFFRVEFQELTQGVWICFFYVHGAAGGKACVSAPSKKRQEEGIERPGEAIYRLGATKIHRKHL